VYNKPIRITDLRLAIRRRTLHGPIGGQQNDDLAFAAPAFNLHSGRYKACQEVATFAAQRFGGRLLSACFFHRSARLAMLAAMLFAAGHCRGIGV
jgi:hypothetical protein